MCYEWNFGYFFVVVWFESLGIFIKNFGYGVFINFEFN